MQAQEPLLTISPSALAPRDAATVGEPGPDAPTNGEELTQVRLGRRQRVVLYLADAISLLVGPIIAGVALSAYDPARAGDLGAPQVVVTAICTFAAMHLHGLYRRPASRLLPTAWWRLSVVLRTLPTAALLTLGTTAIAFGARQLTLSSAVAMVLPAALLVPTARRFFVRLFGPPNVSRILILGTGQVADRLTSRLRRCGDTVVVGYVDDDALRPEGVLGGLADLPALCREHKIDRIIVAFSRTPSHEVLEMVRRLNGVVPVSVVPRLYELHSWRSEVEELHGLPLLHIAPSHLGATERFAKRALDLTIGGLAAALVALPCLLAAVAIKVDSSGSVFFRQERTGRGGRTFRIFKFRTMSTDADRRKQDMSAVNEVDGPLFKMTSDPRVTRVGSFLRRTSFDELPQLLNVLRGEMSLVGPRPLPTDESDRLDGAALTRFDVAPGMTGLWQVSGRSDLSYADLQHLDSVYVRSWSLMWDLRIIRDTPRSVLGGRGAY